MLIKINRLTTTCVCHGCYELSTVFLRKKPQVRSTRRDAIQQLFSKYTYCLSINNLFNFLAVTAERLCFTMKTHKLDEPQSRTQPYRTCTVIIYILYIYMYIYYMPETFFSEKIIIIIIICVCLPLVLVIMLRQVETYIRYHLYNNIINVNKYNVWDFKCQMTRNCICQCSDVRLSAIFFLSLI